MKRGNLRVAMGVSNLLHKVFPGTFHATTDPLVELRGGQGLRFGEQLSGVAVLGCDAVDHQVCLESYVQGGHIRLAQLADSRGEALGSAPAQILPGRLPHLAPRISFARYRLLNTLKEHVAIADLPQRPAAALDAAPQAAHFA